ncbi:MAG: hypothetical protein ACFCUM_05820 [Bacteroidales bacterium]
MEFRLATGKDDHAIRALLLQIPLNGMLRIRYLREPSYMRSVEIQGMPAQTLVGLVNNKIVAVGSRNIQRLYIGGKLRTAGYISNLRYHPGVRHGISLLKGIRQMEELPAGLPVDFHYATLIEKDSFTRNILASNRPRMPEVIDMGLLNTFSVPIRKTATILKPARRFEILRGDVTLMPQILAFLKKEGVRSDFFPELGDGIYAPGLLQPESFFAIFDKGDVAGVCSLHDMKGYRQYILEGYSRLFGMLRAPVNCYYALRRLHSVPRKGEKIKIVFAGFPVVKDYNPEIFSALFSHVYNSLSGSEQHYLSIALHEKNPLNSSISSFPNINYSSRLCIVKLKNDKFAADRISADMLRRNQGIPFIDLPRL